MANALLSEALVQTIDAICQRFPEEQKRSALIMALRAVQEEQGWLSDDALNAVSDHLQLPAIWVYEVASFYTMFRRQPVGQHVLKVCVSISCELCAAQTLLEHLEAQLGIKLGETTPDGLFTLQEAECLAACCDAPVILHNDRTMHRRVTLEQADALIEQLKQESAHA